VGIDRCSTVDAICMGFFSYSFRCRYASSGKVEAVGNFLIMLRFVVCCFKRFDFYVNNYTVLASVFDM